MPTAPGAWQQALGAALLGGSQGYARARKAKVDEEAQRQDMLVQMEREARMKANDELQRKEVTTRLEDLPRLRAKDAVDTLLKINGPGAFDMPEFLKAAETAGAPVATDPEALQQITRAQLNAIEGGNFVDTPIPSSKMLADLMGVAPTTGARLPQAIRDANKAKLDQEAAYED